MLRLVYRVDNVVAVPLWLLTAGLLTLVLPNVVEMNCPWEVLTSIGHFDCPNTLSLMSSGRPRLTLGPENFRLGLTTTCLGVIWVPSIVLIRDTSLLHMLPSMLRLQREALVLGVVLFPDLVS